MKIAVDFDGTVVDNAYPKIGKVKPFAFETLKQLMADGHTLILWTCRQGSLLDQAVEFCKAAGVVFYAVNSNYPEESPSDNLARKITADLFIDDHNFGGFPGWGEIYNAVSSGNALPETDKRGLRLFGKKLF